MTVCGDVGLVSRAHGLVGAEQSVGVVEQPVGSEVHTLRPAGTGARVKPAQGGRGLPRHQPSPSPAISEVSLESVAETARTLYKHFLVCIKHLLVLPHAQVSMVLLGDLVDSIQHVLDGTGNVPAQPPHTQHGLNTMLQYSLPQ